MTGTAEKMKAHRWRFFRSGGFDQVRLDRVSDLESLGELDQKLWAALGCPTRGLEFDSATLDLIDTDGDGRIRAPEILAAVGWSLSVLKNREALLAGGPLPLSALDDGTPEGAKLKSTALIILGNLGKPDAAEISVDDLTDIGRIFAMTKFNGDGVVPRTSAEDDATAAAIDDIVATVGSVPDSNGEPGVNTELAEKFFAECRAFSAWMEKSDASCEKCLPLGDATGQAAELTAFLAPKLDDYFTRCRLAAFDSRAEASMNRSEADYALLAAGDLSPEAAALAAFPLAKVEPMRPLPLGDGVNPAWSVKVAEFTDKVVAGLLGVREELTEGEWAEIRAKLAPFNEWQASKEGAAVEALGVARVRELLASEVDAKIAALISHDKEFEGEAASLKDVERIARYTRDLATLLQNFVNLRDFYTRRAKAIFQAGTLYIDGRSTELCIRVEDAGAHAGLASLSRTYLLYCECVRKATGEKMTVVAGITDGDSDRLTVGRNGIFYDRKNQDWDATIIRIIEHPISIRQAFFAPYKKLSKMIGDQIEKMAAAREKSVHEKAQAGVSAAGKTVDGQAQPPKEPFDVGKFAGIFAAIGLAIGAIGTAIASILTGFLGLTWWKMPLALLGLALVVSTPSVVLAWLKIRQRSLAPILDANGWAVNTRAKLTIEFGHALTSLAKLPKGAERAARDPYGPKRHPVLMVTIVLTGLAIAWLIWRFQLVSAWLSR